VLSVLTTLKAGSVRDLSGLSGGMMTAAQATSTNGEFLIPVGGSGYNGVPANFQESGASNMYSVPDLQVLANTLAASVHITLPMAWSDADYTAFGSYICSSESTYPNIPNYYLECNNEDWNGANDGKWKIPYPEQPGYGLACKRAFRLLSAACADTNIHYLLDGQTNNGGWIGGVTGAQNTTEFPNTAQYGVSDNMYTIMPIMSGDSATTVITNAFNANQACTGSPSDYSPCLQKSLGTSGDPSWSCGNLGTFSSTCNWMFGSYEYSAQGDQVLGTNGGTGSALQGSQFAAGWGSAGITMASLIQSLAAAPVKQAMTETNYFQLSQNVGSNGVAEWGMTAGYWGLDRDFGPFWPMLRPGGLALELYNLAANGGYYPCASAPAGVLCAAFKDSSNNWRAALVNTTSAALSSVTITFPAGTVPTLFRDINYTSGVTDNNEGTTAPVSIVTSTITPSGQMDTMTLPAFTAAVLDFGGASNSNSGWSPAPGFGGLTD